MCVDVHTFMQHAHNFEGFTDESIKHSMVIDAESPVTIANVTIVKSQVRVFDQ